MTDPYWCLICGDSSTATCACGATCLFQGSFSQEPTSVRSVPIYAISSGNQKHTKRFGTTEDQQSRQEPSFSPHFKKRKA